MCRYIYIFQFAYMNEKHVSLKVKWELLKMKSRGREAYACTDINCRRGLNLNGAMQGEDSMLNNVE